MSYSDTISKPDASEALKNESICILTIDDDPFFCEIVQSFLESTPYILDTAMDGETALQKWNASVAHGRPYDLLVVDLGLPRMNGSSLIREVRKASNDVELLVITSEREMDVAYKLLECYRIADYIKKPLRHQALFLFSIRRALEHQRDLRRLRQEIKVRKQAEQNLHLFSKAMEQSSDRMMITDKEGNIEYVNSAFEMITGHPKKSVIGKKPSILKSGKHPPEFYDRLWETILAGSMFRSEIINKHHDGQLYQEEESIEPIRNQEGQITHFISTGRDLTEQYRMNQELRDKNRKLKEMQAGLIQSSKMAALGIMSTGIAHEINQPLNVIRLYAERCLMKQEDQKWLESALKQIIQQVDRTSEITHHMRVFGRKSDQNPEESLVPVDLVKVIKSVITVFIGVEIAGKNIHLIQEYPESFPEIRCNAVEIEQVLLNLILNAKDAVLNSENKKITIRVFLEKEQWAVIEIEDSGEGISEEVMQHIFDPFFTTKSTGKGTGLGLFISYAIMQRHQGELKVSSPEGRGCTFQIKLPLNTL